jgi:hypothetical protein
VLKDISSKIRKPKKKGKKWDRILKQI